METLFSEARLRAFHVFRPPEVSLRESPLPTRKGVKLHMRGPRSYRVDMRLFLIFGCLGRWGLVARNRHSASFRWRLESGKQSRKTAIIVIICTPDTLHIFIPNSGIWWWPSISHDLR